MKRRLALLGFIGLGLSKLAKAQIEFTSIQLKQAKLLFNPAQFDATNVNGITQINLKATPPVAPTFEMIKIMPNVPFAGITLAKNYSFIMLFFNGILQSPDFDYSRVGTTITFLELVPTQGDIITYIGVV